MQTPIAKSATLVGRLAQLLAQTGIIVPGRTATHAIAINIDDTARSPFAHPVIVAASFAYAPDEERYQTYREDVGEAAAYQRELNSADNHELAYLSALAHDRSGRLRSKLTA